MQYAHWRFRKTMSGTICAFFCKSLLRSEIRNNQNCHPCALVSVSAGVHHFISAILVRFQDGENRQVADDPLPASGGGRRAELQLPLNAQPRLHPRWAAAVGAAIPPQSDAGAGARWQLAGRSQQRVPRARRADCPRGWGISARGPRRRVVRHAAPLLLQLPLPLSSQPQLQRSELLSQGEQLDRARGLLKPKMEGESYCWMKPLLGKSIPLRSF